VHWNNFIFFHYFNLYRINTTLVSYSFYYLTTCFGCVRWTSLGTNPQNHKKKSTLWGEGLPFTDKRVTTATWPECAAETCCRVIKGVWRQRCVYSIKVEIVITYICVHTHTHTHTHTRTHTHTHTHTGSRFQNFIFVTFHKMKLSVCLRLHGVRRWIEKLVRTSKDSVFFLVWGINRTFVWMN
jgi:hypothetical protein